MTPWPLPSVERHWTIAAGWAASPLGIDARTCQTVLRAADVTDAPAWFVADPFLAAHDGRWHLFFEVMRRDRRMGEIGWAWSDDGRTWTYGAIVLREVTHLSFPCVVPDGADWFMTAETLATNVIGVYHAQAFPRGWKRCCTLAVGRRLVDPAVVHWHDRWWMFASTPDQLELAIFSARHPAGPWHEHPRSPVRTAGRTAVRSAGRPQVIAGRLIRFVQDPRRGYGTGVGAREVVALDDTRFAERVIPEFQLSGTGRGWNAGGMHHVDAMQTGSEWLVVVDGFRWQPVFGFRTVPATRR